MNFKKIKGDASDREFYRSRNSILVYSKKNKYKNLLVYDCINKILNNHKIHAPKLIKNNYDKSSIQITDLGKKSVKNILTKNNRYKIYKKIIDILIKFKKIKNTKTINLNGKQYCMKKYNYKELNNIGVFEDNEVISLIEWPEKIKFKPKNRIELKFKYLKNFENRNIKIQLFGNCKNYEF